MRGQRSRLCLRRSALFLQQPTCSFTQLLDEDSQEQLQKSGEVIDDAARLPNVDALKDFLQNQTLSRLAQTVQRTIDGINRRAEIEDKPIPDLNEADKQRNLVNALIQGWRKAMEN